MRNKKIKNFIFTLFILIVIGYAGYTARHIILGPELFLDTQSDVVSVETQVIAISGATQNTSELRLNNSTLLLDENGYFSEKILLSVGINTFVLEAIDRFGRSKKETLQVIYTPKEGEEVLQVKDTKDNYPTDN